MMEDGAANSGVVELRPPKYETAKHANYAKGKLLTSDGHRSTKRKTEIWKAEMRNQKLTS